jgi:2'-5' RNA ligase
MQGIALLLDAQHAARVEALWRRLDERFGLRGAFAGAPPHCTLHAAARYDPDVEEALRGLLAEWRPLTLRVEGLGVFPGDRPIIHLAVARGPVLAEMQRQLHDLVDRFATGVDPHLAPDRWMPHITLARDPLPPARLGEVVASLAEGPYQWRIATNRLVILELGEPPRTRFHHSFSGTWGE